MPNQMASAVVAFRPPVASNAGKQSARSVQLKTTKVLTQLRSRLAVREKKLAFPFGWYFHSAETLRPALSGAFLGVSVAFLHLASYQEAL